MFSWICPQCGHEVPPSRSECAFCAEQAAQAAAETQPIALHAPAQQLAQAPPPQHAPPQAAHPQASFPPAAWPPPQQKQGLPTWLLGGIFAVVFLGIGAGAYLYLQRSSGMPVTASDEKAVAQTTTASRQKVSNPLQKYVEVVGLRMVTENKKTVAKFLVVNHSLTDIVGLAANVTLWASTSRSEEDSIGSFSFKVIRLGANESKEQTEPLKTKLKMYELPDWQNTTAEIEITAPQNPF